MKPGKHEHVSVPLMLAHSCEHPWLSAHWSSATKSFIFHYTFSFVVEKIDTEFNGIKRKSFPVV